MASCSKILPLFKAVTRAKEEGVDFVIVAVHWGLEYHLDENVHQRRLAETMFYAGADIVLGTHPHVIQPFEHKKMVDVSGEEKDKYIIYSQGNFISGQRTYPRAIGMYINFDFKKTGIEEAVVNMVSVMPTYVEAEYRNGQRFMRILDVHQAQVDNLNKTLDINDYLLNDLKNYEEMFVAHIASKVDMTPYLNDMNEYVIYKREN
jgi:poly-gamma-glutamate synthesis protein (capsule biosynthesis protein)